MIEDANLLERLADFGSPEEAVGAFFYHGTAEEFSSAPQQGGFDGVFWMADSPAVAQCYIPSSGLKSFLGQSDWRLLERVRPDRHSTWYSLVRQMGFEAVDVEWLPTGDARSWRMPQGYPTYGDVCDWLESELGYENQARLSGNGREYWVKSTFASGQERFLPAGWKMPGRLFAVEGVSELRLLDMATGREGDLISPDHLKLDAFRRAQAGGYDGVMINDFCQSETYGNVGHVSWGVFPSALPRLSYSVVPACRFDWPNDEGCARQVTPEFESAWRERFQIRPEPSRR